MPVILYSLEIVTIHLSEFNKWEPLSFPSNVLSNYFMYTTIHLIHFITELSHLQG